MRNSAKILVLSPCLSTRILVHAMIGLYENAFADVPMKMKGNLDFTSGYFLSPLGAENKDIGAASLMLLTEIKLRL